ncbi:3-methyladenine DNA glycosylase [Roseovarius sp. A46]|uniref:c-type cytochrome n=1 Tax=Roseovarius sp. A46 TaxID=2109331 RepID=UPI0010101AF0|nr:c-type cytochrome [Roseovarius sp. A46]RXV63887.1 3-methyladenine DNA glycosylase [Roseovarius sp. A46]
MTSIFKSVSVTITCLLAGAVQADELGKAEYMSACASCHGESAAGDGPLAELMTVPVPSLTGLSAANDGAYPMLNVIHTIDGRQGTRGHGYPMPVWGSRFKAELENTGPYGAEILVRGRILSIAYYLETLQE